LERFRDGDEIKDFVWQQLRAGAMAALACVRAHYLVLDFAKIGCGAPQYIDGESEDLRPHYDAVDDAAKNIDSLVDRETEAQLGQMCSPE
jgi:hypothetical protein